MNGRPAKRSATGFAARAPISVIVEDARWQEAMPDLRARLRQAARLALARGGRSGPLTILLADDDVLHRLNCDFRGNDKPTNVLSFPAAPNPEGHLGDIAIAFGVTAHEALEAAKPFSDHAVHLAVHGVLHLFGYDHETAAEARHMEPLEVAILAELGIADPYAAHAVA